MSAINLEELTIEQVHDDYKNKRYTTQDLVAAYLDRIQKIDRDDNGPKLNALAAINTEAINQAKSLDDSFSRDGKFFGPLHGIPIVVKDHVMTKDLTTTFGSVIAKDFLPEEDATVITKLRRAGAIILAKASLPDWGTDYFSTSFLLGNVRNPYDPERDAGGSSGGTAAAVSANLAVAGLGSDSAGSIRIPASFCNVVGMRPTVGLISKHGTSPGILGQSTLGPLGRTVKDVALMLDALVGFDEKDTQTGIHAQSHLLPGKGYFLSLTAQIDGSTPRVGVIRSIFGSFETDEGQAVNAVTDQALASFRESGITLVDIELPRLKEFLEGSSLFFSRAKFDLDKFLTATFGVDVAKLVSSERLPPKNVMLPFIAKNGSSSPYEDKGYGKQVDLREEFQQSVLTEMCKHNVSAIVFPSVKIPAPRYAEIDSRTLRAYLPLNVGIASQLRWPAISVPAGFTDANVPVGLEIVGPPLKDQVLLSLAYRFEQAVNARRAPKL